MYYERENIRQMSGYTPGEQPDKFDIVKLNTNENPYPPCDEVIEELHKIKAEDLRRYPPSLAKEFREIASKIHGLNPENIIATNGGDELLRLAITTFLNPGESLGVAQPSYSLYSVLAAVQDCPVIEVPLNSEWGMRKDFSEILNKKSAKMAIVVNPHAPSGRLTSAKQLGNLANEFKGVLMIDEAYVNFIDPELGYDSIQLLKECKNILILGTLSKGYSLAGLRFGYGMANTGIIEPMLTKTKDSYNVNGISQRLATVALKNKKYAEKTWQAVRGERKRLSSNLKNMGLNCEPSQSNFILVTIPETFAGGAANVYQLLKEKGIFIRYFDKDRLRDKLRITIGTTAENDKLLTALRNL
jgi:histidinol-phosphate aminotransferase